MSRLADGNPARRDEANVAVRRGEEKILLWCVGICRRSTKVLPVLSPIDGEQRFDRAVVGKQCGGGQGDDKIGIDHTRRALPYIRNDGTMAGLAHGDGDRPTALDANLFRAHHKRPRPVRGQVISRIVRVDCFEEQIFHIAARVGKPPGDGTVVPEDGERDTGGGDPGKSEPGRLDSGQIPQYRCSETEVGIVGKNRLTGPGQATIHNPAVGAAVGGQRSNEGAPHCIQHGSRAEGRVGQRYRRARGVLRPQLVQ